MKFIYRVIPLIFVAMLLGCSCSSSKYEEQREISDEKGIAPNSEAWEKEESHKLHFAVYPEMALVVVDVCEDNDESTLEEYVVRLNERLPKEYEGDNGPAVIDRITKIGNNLFVKIKVGDKVIKELEDPVQLEVMKLIFIDYLMHTVKYKEFFNSLYMILANKLDLDYHIVSGSKSKDIVIKHSELRDSVNSALRKLN